MNVINTGNNDAKIDLSKFSNIINGKINFINLYTSEELLNKNDILKIEGKKAEMFLVK